MQRTRKHLTFANVVSMIALFAALGGVSYAAINLPKNSVGAKQLKKNAVTGKKIKNNAVTGKKVKNGTLLAKDFKSGQIPGGQTGPRGPVGVVGAVTVQRVDAPLPDNGNVGITASCPAGTKIIGGGGTVQASTSTDIAMTVSRPFKTGAPNNGLPENGESFDAWRVVFVNPTGGTAATTARSFAICAQT